MTYNDDIPLGARQGAYVNSGVSAKAPFTHSRIASRIIPDHNLGSSGVQHHDFVAVLVWVRCELGTYTEQYGVYTDRQGSNTDVAGKAPLVNPDCTDEHGSNWAFTRSFYGRARSLLGIPPECWRCVEKRWPKLPQTKKAKNKKTSEPRMANTSENLQNVLLLVDTMRLKLLLSEAIFLQQQHEMKDGEKTARNRKIHMAMCTSDVISWRQNI